MAKFKRLYACFAVLLAALYGCGASQPAAPAPVAEEEALARTEFTDRIENFFEYAPFKANKPSFFRIHLTDLADGSPVEKAEVTLAARLMGSAQPATETRAKVGKVNGIYVAELTLKQPGTYDIEFHIKNDKLDERLPLADFKVE